MSRRLWIWISVNCGLLSLLVSAASLDPGETGLVAPWLELMQGDQARRAAALSVIEANWRDDSAGKVVEMLRFVRPGELRNQLVSLIESKTGARVGNDWGDWARWMWNRPSEFSSSSLELKRELHAGIDPRFRAYFRSELESRIRYDEIVWGGVRQNGIPPLRSPRMVGPDRALYLEDDNVVFGVVVKNQAYAYPQRILAWHEMFVAQLQGVDLAGVYCTLCGSVILYETSHRGIVHRLGTSGFLYRSNKLMFDEATHSLWSTLEGEPVVGSLVGKGIRLRKRSVVKSSWGQWKARYPSTLVLAEETGFRRDYAEGAAYRDYFATDALMFPVPEADERLRNKAEVLGLEIGLERKRIALAIDFLSKNHGYEGRNAGVNVVVIPNGIGGFQAYSGLGNFGGDRTLVDHHVLDASGKRWKVEESGLKAQDGTKWERIPAHRSFWFGWHAAFPDTELIAED